MAIWGLGLLILELYGKGKAGLDGVLVYCDKTPWTQNERIYLAYNAKLQFVIFGELTAGN